MGGTWQAAGTTWRVTGIVQDPSNLADEFALVAPGQVTHPSQVIMLLGSAAAQQAISGGNGTLPGVPAATVSFPTGSASGFSPATVVLLVEVLGLVFIGLVSVAGFSVMAQRRLRALGMLSAIGATERNLRLVMIVNGLAVGVTGALAGAVLGFAAWFAYVPTLQQATGHVVDAANLPWWAFALGVVFAIATSVLASRRPAKTMAAVPVVAALSGRPPPPKAVHRTVLPGVIVFAVGVVCLATAGGLAGASGHGGSPALHLVAGLVAVIIGIVLLAPLAISMLRASSRLPVAIRIALRDLVRYRARSGAALAATTFAVFLATGICVVTSVQFENVLAWTGPNLSSSQVIVYAQPPQGGPAAAPLISTQLAEVSRHVSSLAASLHARSAVPLESADATLHQVGAQAHKDFTGTVYVATPQLLATYGITAGQIAPGTDVLTMRPGMASLPHMELTWGNYGVQQGPGGLVQKDSVLPSCTLSSDCLASPRMQTVSSLPSGTSAPNTVITEYAVSNHHLQTHLAGWLIQAPAPSHRRADQRRAAIRPHLRGDGRDRVGLARPRRDRRRRHRARHRDRARRAGHVGRPDPQRDRAGPAHAHRDRRQRHDPADDHRRDRRSARPARRHPWHGRRGDRRAGLGPQQPVRHVRRRAADRRADPAARAAADRRRRRLAIRRAEAASGRQAAD